MTRSSGFPSDAHEPQVGWENQRLQWLSAEPLPCFSKKGIEMHKTKLRVLHGIRQSEQLLDALAQRREAVVRIPIERVPKTRKGLMLCRINVHCLMLGAFDQFYRGTELMGMLKSAVAVIDVKARTIVLTQVRVRSVSKYLPRMLHDMRVY